MRRSLQHGRSSTAGSAAVEFAILAIPLMVLFTGITEYGRALYYYNAVVKAARDGVRLLSTQTPADPGYAALVTSATCTVVHGNAACDGDPLLPGLTTAMVSVCDPQSCPGTHAAVATGTGVANLVTLTVGAQGGYAFTIASAARWRWSSPWWAAWPSACCSPSPASRTGS
jgi:Flp pilus assembly protein TadG